MIRHARSLLRPGGYVAIVLPLACVDHSRNFNEKLLADLMARLEFVPREIHRSPKLFFGMYHLSDSPTPDAELDYESWRTQRIRRGSQYNNFSIELLNAKDYAEQIKHDL